MAEIYWFDGFEKTLMAGQTLAGMVHDWLDEIYVRAAWVDQVNVLSDGNLDDLTAALAEGEKQAGFVFSSTSMDEHFLLQQVLRRMRMDESESQLLVHQVGQTIYGALFVSHRQVGKFNLLPKLIVAEQMAVLQPQQLQNRLAAFPENLAQGVYLTGIDGGLISDLAIDGVENASQISNGKVSLLSVLMEINRLDELKSHFGLLVSQAKNQPLLITSVQGC